jgi:apolipoprotein N-acyltransferase
MTALPNQVASATPDDGRRVWLLALAGAVTMFLVQPPADLWWLAWLAPLPWLALVTTTRLDGRPWLAIWTGGFIHWLFTIHWLRLPHPATSIGWVALAAYLACYVPLFVWAARRLVHGRGWPLVPAAALAWMACEQLRGAVLGGFSFGTHLQFQTGGFPFALFHRCFSSALTNQYTLMSRYNVFLHFSERSFSFHSLPFFLRHSLGFVSFFLFLRNFSVCQGFHQGIRWHNVSD